MPDFSIRSSTLELMDDLGCSGPVVDQTLRELETINELLGGNYVTINGLEKLLSGAKGKFDSINITDVGCGSGDILRLIAAWAQRRKLNVRLLGVDANRSIIDYARAHTPDHSTIDFKTLDIFADEFRAINHDVVVGTLFFHHFSDEELIAFFSSLRKNLNIGIVINDIHRHWFAYHSIRWLTRLLSKSPMVKYDAPLSVLRAFRKSELRHILEKSGFTRFTIRWMWAFRWQVVAWM